MKPWHGLVVAGMCLFGAWGLLSGDPGFLDKFFAIIAAMTAGRTLERSSEEPKNNG